METYSQQLLLTCSQAAKSTDTDNSSLTRTPASTYLTQNKRRNHYQKQKPSKKSK